jgi:hypothetical protein
MYRTTNNKYQKVNCSSSSTTTSSHSSPMNYMVSSNTVVTNNKVKNKQNNDSINISMAKNKKDFSHDEDSRTPQSYQTHDSKSTVNSKNTIGENPHGRRERCNALKVETKVTAIDLCQQDSPLLNTKTTRIKTPLSSSSNLFGDRKKISRPSDVDRNLDTTGDNVISILNSVSSVGYVSNRNVKSNKESITTTTIDEDDNDASNRVHSPLNLVKRYDDKTKTIPVIKHQQQDKNRRTSWTESMHNGAKQIISGLGLTKQNNPDSDKIRKQTHVSESAEDDPDYSDYKGNVFIILLMFDVKHELLRCYLFIPRGIFSYFPPQLLFIFCCFHSIDS